ncbi:V-type proton ATPase 16 kDa proteolipid subunit-like [Gracilinanus agilis]|uniref:V-type proton ATPase 16 kDa proteolipid subunit-like n=1 Tax=Gracilinanus agilis TaxID=191870 RepID=UPI001CFD5904|nr:V-type proton ATPase 16 kDa proteolipid subunit-like [Gracilinanus agilis]
MRPELTMKSIIPIFMVGFLAIYGLVMVALIVNSLTPGIMLFKTFHQLGSGLNIELSRMEDGFATDFIGDAGVLETVQQPKLFVGINLILMFPEMVGFYGLIVAYILSTMFILLPTFLSLLHLTHPYSNRV